MAGQLKTSPSTGNYYWDDGAGNVQQVQVLKSPSTGRTFWKAGGQPPVEFDPADIGEQLKPPPEQYRGAVIPASLDEQGNAQFDSDAGLVGVAKRVVTTPRDVISGELDPMSREGMGRMLEAAAIMSPASAATRAAGTTIRPTSRPAPTQAELKAASDAGYKRAADMGVEYSAPAVQKFAQEVEEALYARSSLPDSNPELFRLLKSIREQPPGSVSARLQELDQFRMRLGELAGDPSRAKAGAAQLAQRMLDDFLDNPGTSGVMVRTPAGGAATAPSVPGQAYPSTYPAAQEAIETLKAARGNAAANFRSGDLMQMEYIANLRRLAANSGRNYDNTTRQRLTGILQYANRARGFNDVEKQAIESIIKGGKIKEALRYIGNLLGAGGGWGQSATTIAAGTGGYVAGGGVGGMIGMAVPAIVGNVAKSTANALTKSEVKVLDNLIRSRSPLAAEQQAAAPMIRRGPVKNPVTKRGLAQALMSRSDTDLDDAQPLPPQVPLTAGGTQADLLQRRLLDSLKRSGQPWT